MNLAMLMAKVVDFLGLVLSGVDANKDDYSKEIAAVEREIEALKKAAADYDAADRAALDAAVPPT